MGLAGPVKIAFLCAAAVTHPWRAGWRAAGGAGARAHFAREKAFISSHFFILRMAEVEHPKEVFMVFISHEF